VIDTTAQLGSAPKPAPGQTAALRCRPRAAREDRVVQFGEDCRAADAEAVVVAAVSAGRDIPPTPSHG
jgi:hypothetical protein